MKCGTKDWKKRPDFSLEKKNIPGMLSILEPLHKMMERGPETIKEISFSQAFGRDLQEVQKLGKL